MEAASRAVHSCDFGGRETKLEIRHVSRVDDDPDDVSVTWHAGPVSRLSAVDARRQRSYHLLHCDSLQHWRGAGDANIWTFFGKSGQKTEHDLCAFAVTGCNSRMG